MVWQKPGNSSLEVRSTWGTQKVRSLTVTRKVKNSKDSYNLLRKINMVSDRYIGRGDHEMKLCGYGK